MWDGRAGLAGAVVRAALWPAEGLFRAAVAVRAGWFGSSHARAAAADIPVVSVGNLSVGGTGKTPVASWVVRTLADAGCSPALVSRGYGRDEILLHRQWTPSVRVVADPDRRRGVAVSAKQGADVAVLDDGFQHRRLARDLDLVLVSAEEGLPGPLLPRGPFREPVGALKRAHAVLVTRKEASEDRARELARAAGAVAPGILVARVRFLPGAVRSMGEGMDVPSVLPGDPVVVVTAVARPASVTAAVESLGIPVSETIAFPDHHEFTPADVAGLLGRSAGRPVVVTEKDAVKLSQFPMAREGGFWVMEQELVWEEGREAVEALLRHAVRERAR